MEEDYYYLSNISPELANKIVPAEVCRTQSSGPNPISQTKYYLILHVITKRTGPEAIPSATLGMAIHAGLPVTIKGVKPQISDKIVNAKLYQVRQIRKRKRHPNLLAARC